MKVKAVVESVLDNVKQHSSKPFVVGYRISPEELEEPGITLEDTFQLVDQLGGKNLDYIHLSLNEIWRESIRNENETQPVLERLQERIGHKMPLIGVGSIKKADQVVEAIDKGIPLVAVGRALILDPDWVTKIQNGQEETIRQKISSCDIEELEIPEPMWEGFESFPGWIPIEE